MYMKMSNWKTAQEFSSDESHCSCKQQADFEASRDAPRLSIPSLRSWILTVRMVRKAHKSSKSMSLIESHHVRWDGGTGEFTNATRFSAPGSAGVAVASGFGTCLLSGMTGSHTTGHTLGERSNHKFRQIGDLTPKNASSFAAPLTAEREVSIKVSPPRLAQLGGHFRLFLAATDHEGLPKSFK